MEFSNIDPNILYSDIADSNSAQKPINYLEPAVASDAFCKTSLSDGLDLQSLRGFVRDHRNSGASIQNEIQRLVTIIYSYLHDGSIADQPDRHRRLLLSA